MSLLWPDTLHVGLFPGTSWLKTGRKKAIQPFVVAVDQDPDALLRSLEVMLDTMTVKPRKGSRVIVTVSDTVAAITALPWQPALSRPGEVHSYARICFDKLGITIDGTWAMHAEFRRYAVMGWAYALPNGWIGGLIALLRERGLQLRTVLPASAKALAYRAAHRQAGKQVILLQEALRNSALILGKEGLCGYDAEPVIGSPQESSVRLLTRISARHGAIGRLIHWPLDAAQEKPVQDGETHCLPGATCEAMAQDIWER